MPPMQVAAEATRVTNVSGAKIFICNKKEDAADGCKTQSLGAGRRQQQRKKQKQ